VSNIGTDPGAGFVQLENGTHLEHIEAVNDPESDAVKRVQIAGTIEDQLDR
jgi:hypothetical protein